MLSSKIKPSARSHPIYLLWNIAIIILTSLSCIINQFSLSTTHVPFRTQSCNNNTNLKKIKDPTLSWPRTNFMTHDSEELSLLLLSPIPLFPPSFSLALSHFNETLLMTLFTPLFHSHLLSVAFLTTLLKIASPWPFTPLPTGFSCFIALQSSHYHVTSSMFYPFLHLPSHL